ncbi:MAG: PTS sugar transporter subunit IIA [bacterium]|nr:PTS sugar transporter subunit IIA [bacterium]
MPTRLRHLLDAAPIALDVAADSVDEAVEALVDVLIESGALSAERRERVLREILDREQEQSTALGQGVAVPHGFLDELDAPLVALARLRDPLDAAAPDGEPVELVYLITGGRADAGLHLELLMSIARLQSDPQFRRDVDAATMPGQILDAVDAFLARSEAPVVAPGRPDGLDVRGFARGVLEDIRRRLPLYASDFADGLHPKSVAAILFLFFACVAPAVAFGGLMAALTGGEIGAMEMIVATAIGGTLYALFSGQPLTILGGTGPMLVFTGMLYELCGLLELPFLPAYAWVGLWTAAFTILCAVTGASSLIRYCTRFTDEVFALLISLIFINEAVANLADTFSDPRIDDYRALLSLVLAVATFWIAITLRNSRRSRYLRWWMRQFMADFGSVIAIATATGVAIWLGVQGLPTLAVPDHFATTSGRPWLVDLWGLPAWAIFGASIPALLCTVLVFLDHNITNRLVNQTDHSLQKSPAYHLDLLVVGVLTAGLSLFALPWLVAATIRSLNHVRALASVEEIVRRDGSTEERIVAVREQRVTALAIHLLIGFSVFALPWLQTRGIEIPMAVLYGLFFFMGVTSLAGNQFFERLRLWVMDPSHYPRTHYVRQVPLRQIHLFTAIQLAGLVVLWAVKVSPLALIFPLFIVMLVPLRIVLDRFFEERHLESLDSDVEEEEPSGEAAG